MILGEIDGLGKGDAIQWSEGLWEFDQEDFLVFAMLCDPVYAPELMWDDPSNTDYSGCYRVRDYQYPLFRMEDEDGDPENYAGAACARSVGKTESIKARSFCHTFRRQSQNLLVTAPELIHLLPLTDAVEERIYDTTLTREFLDTRQGKTGFTHRPFGVEFLDGTKIVGRIPRLTGTGVKGQHQPDLIIDEAQDYPERGWVEVHETVMKDTADFTYHFYGVHSGARDTGFYKRINEGAFRLTQITALQRPDWNERQKQAAKAAYGGTSSPDYRRNILGEAGSPASAFFVTARLMACVDQNRESDYNNFGYVHQMLRSEEVDELQMPISEIMDFPGNHGAVYAGMDVGLTNSPTILTVCSLTTVNKTKRLQLVRRYEMERFRTRQIREATYAMAWHFGGKLMAFGMDVTGLGFPMFQEMEDDEAVPPRLLEVSRGYFFNAKVPVGVDSTFVTKDQAGNLRDQFGAAVKVETDPLTGITRYITTMPMIEASTRYLREMIDSGFLMLPFDPPLIQDMMAETVQRVKALGERTRKPNALHSLDALRGMAMGYKAGDVEEALALPEQEPVLDMAL